MDDLISVIVPVYKVEAYLNHCVESIVNQTYINLEIILVDDGSPDRCPKMCDAWAERDKRIRVIHKENGGLSDARNAGIQIASGKYMGFVDADDWIAAEMYERLLNVLRKDDSDIAACSVVMVWEDGDWEKLLTVKETALLDSDQAEKALMEETLLKNPVWYKLYKTASVRDIPFEKGKQHEDVYWSYQAVGKAQKVSIIDYVGYFYRQRTSSIMGKEIVFGFRPEAVVLGQCENAYKLGCSVELTEMLGDNVNVYIDMGEDKSILKVDPHDAPEMDTEIEFSIPYENVYLFDGETEKVIEA